jgi:hypothetical protein
VRVKKTLKRFSPAGSANAASAIPVEARSASKIDVEGSVEGKADHILVG